MDNPNSDQAPATPMPENSNSGEDTLPPTTTETYEDKPDKEDPDILRQPKRRKNCPSALDKFDSVDLGSNLGFSFSFDPKFGSGCSTPEVTPKFGSFNRVKPVSSKDPKSEESVLLKEDDDVDDDDNEEKSDVILLTKVDGIRTVD